ncbi:zf-HC2 domain-containing protein [Streptomyces sp. Ag109_O5-10]|uniref:zf-HC2 domain-containing protein n=1 Tax=Streptomyces sp. Ag109_O5-10 TaxID=1855349 RepID=UPI0008984E6B|nr:zf-HC2 domain-containing protein [Streptomyces sp. Ag109_O5-10]SEE85258.1 Putative zinc-finger [Streptomyces sp. Ag109_O5-10]
MGAEHDALRLALGGYVLGTLPPAEMERVRVHLAACDECGAEHARLAGLPALLATVTAAEAEAAGRTLPAADGDLADRLVAQAAESAQLSSPAPPAAAPQAPQAAQTGVLESLLQRAAARRRRSRRLQLAGAAASLAFVAAAAGGTWLATVGTVTSQATPPGATAPTASRTFSGSDPTTGVTASVRVYPSAWGSVLQVHAKGAPAGITCRLQAVGPGGTRADGATWRAGEYPPGTTVQGAVDMSPGAIQHFEILAGDGQKLVTIRS